MTRRLTAAARFGLLIGAAIVLAPAAMRADEARELPVQEVERIVRDYLMREPEVIYEALQELQRRQAAEAAERQRLAVLENRDALLNDAKDPVAGDPEAEVTMVEFFDYRCTYCRRVVAAIQSLLEDESDLRIVFKDLPVLGEDSVRAARAALASRRQNGYLPFHFALMQANDLSQENILKIAGNLGLDGRQLARDMNAPEIDRAIEANYALANRLGIEGTPAFVIGDQLVPGAIDEARMRSLIEAARSS